MAILEFEVNFPNSSPGLFLLDSVAKLVTLPLQGSEQDCHWETGGSGALFLAYLCSAEGSKSSLTEPVLAKKWRLSVTRRNLWGDSRQALP